MSDPDRTWILQSYPCCAQVGQAQTQLINSPALGFSWLELTTQMQKTLAYQKDMAAILIGMYLIISNAPPALTCFSLWKMSTYCGAHFDA